MEEKLDGERMQLHMRGSGAQWFYCSRKSKDYSESPTTCRKGESHTQLTCTERISAREV